MRVDPFKLSDQRLAEHLYHALRSFREEGCTVLYPPEGDAETLIDGHFKLAELMRRFLRRVEEDLR